MLGMGWAGLQRAQQRTQTNLSSTCTGCAGAFPDGGSRAATVGETDTIVAHMVAVLRASSAGAAVVPRHDGLLWVRLRRFVVVVFHALLPWRRRRECCRVSIRRLDLDTILIRVAIIGGGACFPSVSFFLFYPAFVWLSILQERGRRGREAAGSKQERDQTVTTQLAVEKRREEEELEGAPSDSNRKDRQQRKEEEEEQ